MYIGILVNHKTVTSKIYKTKTVIAPEEQYRHENFCSILSATPATATIAMEKDTAHITEFTSCS
ncbi:MAG: hypothetical protein HDT42_03280 [Ruminococcaceae bacterium]|nr:hypothetical protein [Oscillospiraceae bacterium]